MSDKLFEDGLKIRKEVLGAEYVEKSLKSAGRYTLPMQELATQAAWGLIWTRPGISRKWRSVLNIGMLVALNMHHELKLHIVTALRNGLTKEEVVECLLQTAMYCGFPAALAASRTAQDAFAEYDSQPKPEKKKKKKA
jgi:4-carboxymuconolactone decarboxylase